MAPLFWGETKFLLPCLIVTEAEPQTGIGDPLDSTRFDPLQGSSWPLCTLRHGFEEEHLYPKERLHRFHSPGFEHVKLVLDWQQIMIYMYIEQ